MAGWPYWFNYVRNAKKGKFSYSAIHNRLYRTLGSAKNKTCILCDDRAREWAYVGNSPFEMIGENQRKEPRLFSPRMVDYVPMCKSCHNKHDRKCKENRMNDGIDDYFEMKWLNRDYS